MLKLSYHFKRYNKKDYENDISKKIHQLNKFYTHNTAILEKRLCRNPFSGVFEDFGETTDCLLAIKSSTKELEFDPI